MPNEEQMKETEKMMADLFKAMGGPDGGVPGAANPGANPGAGGGDPLAEMFKSMGM